MIRMIPFEPERAPLTTTSPASTRQAATRPCRWWSLLLLMVLLAIASFLPFYDLQSITPETRKFTKSTTHSSDEDSNETESNDHGSKQAGASNKVNQTKSVYLLEPKRCSNQATHKPLRPYSWVPYSDIDEAWYNNFSLCLGMFTPLTLFSNSTLPERKRYKLATNDEKLIPIESPRQVFGILSRFEKLWFVGDSVLEQVFYAMLCMLQDHDDSSSSFEFIMKHLERVSPKFQASPKTLVDRRFRLPAYDPINSQDKANKKDLPEIRYSHYGLKFYPNEEPLYRGAFVESLESSSSSLTIVGAGVHYQACDIEKLHKAARFIRESSLSSAGNEILYMESAPQEFQTSNGGWTGACIPARNFTPCTCQVLTPGRIQGQGFSDFFDPLRSRLTGQYDLTSNVLNLSYYLNYFDGIYNQTALKLQLIDPDCIPNCLPSNWRNDLVRNVFCDSKMEMIDIWNPFSTYPSLQARKVHDCTHKDAPVVFEMAKQLLRAIKRANYSSN